MSYGKRKKSRKKHELSQNKQECMYIKESHNLTADWLGREIPNQDIKDHGQE